MKSSQPIAIIGGYDLIARSFFSKIKILNKKSIFINVHYKKIKKKSVYNYEIFQLKKILDTLKKNEIKKLLFIGKISRPNLSLFKKDGEIDTLGLIVDHDRYRKNYNRGFVGSEVIHTYKKSPLVSNSLKYPGSIFPTEGYIYRLQIDEEMKSIKFINSDAILYSFIAYD